MGRKRIFVVMDGVLVDFQSGIDQQNSDTLEAYEGRIDEIPGLFAHMSPVSGAIDAMHVLQRYSDWIAVTAYLLEKENIGCELIVNDAVRVMSAYTDFEINFQRFFGEFTLIAGLAERLYKDTPEWVQYIVALLGITDSKKAEYGSNYIFETEFGSKVMQQLQTLKESGLCVDIIKQDYSAFLQ